MFNETKISRYYTLITRNEVPVALFNSRTRHLTFNYAEDFSTVKTNVGFNSANEAKSVDEFYNKLEKIEK